jgi:hypothetical protein
VLLQSNHEKEVKGRKRFGDADLLISEAGKGVPKK